MTVEVQSLPANASAQEMRNRQRLGSSLWRTLWADITYAPHGLVQDADLSSRFRFQVWVSQPALAMEISGSTGFPPFRHIAVNGRGYYAMNSDLSYLQADWPQGDQKLVQNPLVAALLFPGQSSLLKGGGVFRATGKTASGSSSRVAGRPAVMMDWLEKGMLSTRFWIDAQTGIILRLVRYGAAGESAPLSEIAVQSIVYDADFPASLFNPAVPWQGEFSPDYRGPAPIPADKK